MIPDETIRMCPWFPNIECDEICSELGCGNQGLLIHMRASGVPQAEIGGDPDFHPDNSSTASFEVLAVDPFATLPLEFRLDRCDAALASVEDLRIQIRALEKAAQARGLTCRKWEDHALMQFVWVFDHTQNANIQP